MSTDARLAAVCANLQRLGIDPSRVLTHVRFIRRNRQPPRRSPVDYVAECHRALWYGGYVGLWMWRRSRAGRPILGVIAGPKGKLP